MKKIAVFVISVLLSAGLFAETLSLKSICSGLATHPNTTGDFTQIKTINANGRQLKSSGNFIISADGIMWKTVKPFPSSIVITKTAMIQTSADGKQSVMSGKDNQIFENIAGTLSSVFAGDSAQLEKAFSVELEQDGSNWKVILTPKDSTISSVMQTLALSGTCNGTLIVMEGLELQETSSNKIRYEFTNQKYPKDLTADEKANFELK